jgi:ribosomal subunit interface protein
VEVFEIFVVALRIRLRFAYLPLNQPVQFHHRRKDPLMDVHLTARHCKLQPDEQAAARAAATSFTKYIDGITRVDGIFDSTTAKSCEFAVRVHGHVIVARNDADGFSKAIHDAAHSVIRQLRKLKTRELAPRHSSKA